MHKHTTKMSCLRRWSALCKEVSPRSNTTAHKYQHLLEKYYYMKQLLYLNFRVFVPKNIQPKSPKYLSKSPRPVRNTRNLYDKSTGSQNMRYYPDFPTQVRILLKVKVEQLFEKLPGQRSPIPPAILQKPKGELRQRQYSLLLLLLVHLLGYLSPSLGT